MPIPQRIILLEEASSTSASTAPAPDSLGTRADSAYGLSRTQTNWSQL